MATPPSFRTRLIERQDSAARLYRSTRKKLRRKTVHDLRVSLRKLVAALELLEPLEAPVSVKKTRRRLKSLQHSLRELRDLQVQRRRVRQEDPRKLSRKKARVLLKELTKREKQTRREARRALEAYPPRKVRREIQALARHLQGSARANPAFERELGTMAERHVRERFRQVLDAIEALPRRAPSPLAIHQIRIRFKRFRYAWDLVKPPEKTFASFQSLLGEIQDLHVLLSTLAQIEGRPGKQLVSYARILARERAERVAKLHELANAYFRQYPFGRGEVLAPLFRERGMANSLKSREKPPAPRSRSEA